VWLRARRILAHSKHVDMQSTRFLITLVQEHKHFWDTVITSAKPFVIENQGEDAWKRNEDRFKSFRAAYGTVSIFCIK
jgi:predicted oxidoreductase (fatty acid repression mutant protein)